MKIIAHRGFWQSEAEKNTPVAFKRATLNGFGIETDVRDSGDDLVVAHDPFSVGSQSFADFYSEVKDLDLTFAINIKADGLSDRIFEILDGPQKAQFVFFDMSGPEHKKYIEKKLCTLNRLSEYENPFAFPDAGADVWLDAFQSSEWQINLIKKLTTTTARIFVVSPELHGRNHIETWTAIASLPDSDSIFLCTDLPKEAEVFFRGAS